MPLNKEVFRVRAMSAVVFAIIMLGGLLWNEFTFWILFSIIHMGCWGEYVSLREAIHKRIYHLNLILGFIALGYGIMLAIPEGSFFFGFGSVKVYPVFILVVGGTLLAMLGLIQQKLVTMKSVVMLATGLLYISISWGMMLALRGYTHPLLTGTPAWLLPFLLIGSIWINDTMAYLVGSFIGKTPLSPISPKKTWEGTIGGAILAISIVALLAISVWDTPLIFAIGIPAIGAIAGTFGDLFESKLKRMAGVKDSGNMMPGHGGFLDRFDSMLLATPVAYVFVQIVKYL